MKRQLNPLPQPWCPWQAGTSVFIGYLKRGECGWAGPPHVNEGLAGRGRALPERCIVCVNNNNGFWVHKVLLVYQRILTEDGHLYESLAGLERDHGTKASDVYAALKRITRQVALVRKGKRYRTGETVNGVEDYYDEVSTLALNNNVWFVQKFVLCILKFVPCSVASRLQH